MSVVETVYASGAVCWREIDGNVHVLVIHRTQHRDISLPKGKVDPGETLPQTAVREIREETGFKVALGVPLGVSAYLMPNGKNKEVHYWAAHVTDKAIQKSDFVPNDEVEALEWLTIPEARVVLTYEPDRVILDNFTALVDKGVRETFALIVLRHAIAVSPSTWPGSDDTRPLSEAGQSQARRLPKTLGAWRPRRIVASSARRCRHTVAPFAEYAAREVTTTRNISQEAFESGIAKVRKTVGKRVTERKSAILCSHGPVIPEILREIALATGTPTSRIPHSAALLETGAFTVVHLSVARPSMGILAVESHPHP
jgi:8-oxo-dGTP diphosphatase